MKGLKTLTSGLTTVSRYGVMALLALSSSTAFAQSTLPEVEACHREHKLSPGSFIQCAAGKWQADIDRLNAAHTAQVANLQFDIAKTRSDAAAVTAAIDKEKSDYQARRVAAKTEKSDSLQLFCDELGKSWRALSNGSSVMYDQSNGWVFAQWNASIMFALNFEGIATASIDRSNPTAQRLRLSCSEGKNWCAFGFQDGKISTYKNLSMLVDPSNVDALLLGANRAISAFPNQ